MNEYLWEFAQAFPSENRFQLLLKSALSMTASAEVGKTNEKWMCRKCKTLWMHGCFQVDEVAGTARYDALLEKHSDVERRSREQRKHYEYMQSRKATTAKFTCTICSYKTRIPVKGGETISKPLVEPIKATPTAITPNIGNSSKKNRKRKKDPTAGLTIVAPKKKGNISQAIGTGKPATFSSKQPSQLQALAAALKKKKAGETEGPVDRLKLMLK
ncbi:uncharacterized protein LOC119766570 [Culex quinquefasciatus]|uniref:uncharacterized protein LOC119766570 n=1 Tax=Culex quinquefasciatus TaxID=7176 RepID=UPI0018E398A7|nr:uncharacterized protein LOC119766570 [Culex quinquefasciatus]